MAILGAAVLVTGGIVHCQGRRGTGRLAGTCGRWSFRSPSAFAVPLVRRRPMGPAKCLVRRRQDGCDRRSLLTLVLFLVLGGLVGIGDLSVSGRWPLLLPLSVALAGAAVALWPRDQVKRFKP